MEPQKTTQDTDPQNCGGDCRNPAPHIAVVDDDASFLRSVGRLLRAAGYPVETFGSGRAFLASLKTHVPKCLVVDIHMPEMSGLELHDRLRARGSRFPVVFVTAYETPQTNQHVHEAGCGLLLKPFDKEALLIAIDSALEHRPQSAGAC